MMPKISCWKTAIYHYGTVCSPKDEENRCEGEAKGKQVKKLNDEGCKRCLGEKRNQPALYSSQMDSLRTILSIHRGLIYISTVCTYVASLTSQQIDKWSVHMVQTQMTS